MINVDWKEFEGSVYDAANAANDTELTEEQRNAASTFAVLGIAILDIVARLDVTPDKSVERSTLVLP